MGVQNCFTQAADDGDISLEEASWLMREFDRRFAQHRLAMGDDAAKAKARVDLEAALRASAIEKRRRADLTEARRLGIKGYLQGYRDRNGQPNVFEGAMALLSHYGYRGGSSMRGRAEAITVGAHRRMDEVMFTFRRKGLLGRRENRALVSEFVRELHGEATGNATAKALGHAVTGVFEDLRLRFNAAGGAIGKLENFGLPHSHDRLKVKRAGRDGWKAEIRALVDPSRMVDPLSGQPVGAAGLDSALDHVWESIVSNNRAHLKPQARASGRGALATQRQDERFLVFRDAASWEAYNSRFGQGDPIQAVFRHVNSMARDIAAMETLGPNPAAMLEYLKQVVALETGKLETGKPSLAKARPIVKDSQAAYEAYRLDSLYATLRGTGEVVSGAANFTANVKNLMVSAQLGATSILAAATDPFIARAANKLAGLPTTNNIGAMVKMLSRQNRDQIVRSGVIWDEYMHVMHDELRWAGPAVGADWSRWMADRGVTWSGLKPLTTGRKLVAAREWQGHLADMAGKTFAQLDPRLRTALEGFGVEQRHWEIWRKGKDPAGFVTPAQIEANGGPVQYLDLAPGRLPPAQLAAERKALDHREAAEKLAEVISSWSERSVPAGTPNARSVITGAVQRGTVTGELVDYMLQYKSFGLSFTSLQLEAMGEMAAARGGGQGRRSGLGYFAALAIPLTLGGAAYMQIKNLLDGKESEPMDEPAFWIKAAVTGGGFGLFGDFAKASENRFGQQPITALAGPGVAFLGDALGLTFGNAIQTMQWAGDVAGGAEKPTKVQFGRELTKFGRRYTPFVASHWATRGAWNRVVMDNLQWLVDPEADKSFKAMARTAKKNGAPYRVAPGALVPRN